MKCFYCVECGMMVFFENHHCVKCGRRLGFVPDLMTIEALDEQPGNQWSLASKARNSRRYRKCENENRHRICNWMVLAEDKNPFCPACRLNEFIPDLTTHGNIERWRKLELAKKRCLYTLMCLGLPHEGIFQECHASLRFRFLADSPANATVVTGHQAGVITVNVAEADDEERERRRLRFREPYRTLEGHLRHELGHFYWEHLIAKSPHIPRFRQLFGDETADYRSSLEKYYRQGPASDWSQRTVTAYASSHPWEDWAESWAHYLHIYDTLQTAHSFGLGVHREAQAGPVNMDNFNDMIEKWLPLSRALNAVNRGMGLPDLYPFVIPEAAVEKLRFIHGEIASWRSLRSPG